MPPLPVWLAGFAIVPTSAYSLYNYVYIPRVSTQSEAERLSDAVTRPRQLLESDLMVLGGVSAKPGAWSAPNGQRDTPYTTPRIPSSDIPNGDKFDCNLPPYHQPTGFLPQTNAEKIALFSVLQYLRLALVRSPTPGNCKDPLGSITPSDPMLAAAAAASLAPHTLKGHHGMLVAESRSAGGAKSEFYTSSKISAPAIGSAFVRLSDQNREELLRRIAHTEMAKLFQLITEGDTRFISATRVARHAGLPKKYDTVILDDSSKKAHAVGPETKRRFIRSREDGLFVSKPFFFWVRPRIVKDANKSGTVTTVATGDDDNEFDFESEESATNSPQRNASVTLPNATISLKALERKLGHENGEVHDALRKQGFSRMLASPYLRFRAEPLSKEERIRSSLAFFIYATIFKNLEHSTPRYAAGLRKSEYTTASSSRQLIARSIEAQTGLQTDWIGMALMGRHGSFGTASFVSSTLALATGLTCSLAVTVGLFERKFSSEWNEDLRYRIADFTIHRLLNISTRLSIVTQDGKLEKLTENGELVEGAISSERISLELCRSDRKMLMTVSPSLWVEELGIYAAAVGLRHLPKDTLDSVAILSLPSVSFPTFFNILLLGQCDESCQSNAKFRCGLWNRTDLFPLGIMTQKCYSGFPCAPSPLSSFVSVRLRPESGANATADGFSLVETCEISHRPVAITGTESLVLAETPLSKNDPLFYSFPDQKVVLSGIDTQNAIEQLQARGKGNDDNVFVADEKERLRLQKASAIAAVGGRVGKGKASLKPNILDSNQQNEDSANIEQSIWYRERILPTGLPATVKHGEFPSSYENLRSDRRLKEKSKSQSDGAHILATTTNTDRVFGVANKVLEFTIGEPTSALPTVEVVDGKPRAVALDFASLGQLPSLVTALFLASNKNADERVSSSFISLFEQV